MASDSRHTTPRPPAAAAAAAEEAAGSERGSSLRMVDMSGFLHGERARAAEEEAAARARPAADIFGGFTRWFDENNLLCGTYKEASPCRPPGAQNDLLPSFGAPAPVRPRPPAFVNPDLQWRTNGPPEASRWPSTQEASSAAGPCSPAAISGRFQRADGKPRVSEVVVAPPSAPRTPNYVSLVTSFVLDLPDAFAATY